MKKLYTVLLPAIMLLAIQTNAQDAMNGKLATKTAILFGKKLPPSNFTILPGNSLPGNVRFGTHTPLADINYFNKSTFKERLDYFMQMLHNKQNNHAPQNRISINASTDNSNFHLTKDINALAESYPHNSKYSYLPVNLSFAILHQVIYFSADDGIHGSELWRSDGTDAGTYMVMDIEPGVASSSLYNITAVNDKIYFSATTDNYGAEPWVSDGTNSGTHLLMDVIPGSASSNPDEFIELKGETYFVTDDGIYSDVELWKTGGTTESTKLVTNIANSGSNYIYELTKSQGLLFFQADDNNTFAPQLWRTDGTKKGTYSLRNDITLVDLPLQFTNYNNKLYFSSDDGSGRKLWISDGTDAGTMPAPGNNNVIIDFDPYYYDITPFPISNNALYIAGNSQPSGNALYKYDANNNNGVTKVKGFINDSGFVTHLEMQAVNNTLFFKVTIYTHDELWSTNGDKESTKLVNKFQPGETISNLYSGNNHLYFSKHDNFFGTELWTLLQTPFGNFPVIVRDIFNGDAGSYPSNFTAFKDRIFFSATDDKKGNELFMTNAFGIGYGAALVKDINTTSTSSSYAGQKLFGFPSLMTPFKNGVLFNAYENKYGYELYKSNGTEQGTFLLNDISLAAEGSFPYDFLSKDDNVYFLTFTDNRTSSIYKTDGTKSGLKKMTPDYMLDYTPFGSYAVAGNGLIFYTLYNQATFYDELWRTDGTSAGTFRLSSSTYSEVKTMGNTAFFTAGDVTHGYELWKSDGTMGGTKMVKDIDHGTDDAIPADFFVYNNEIYFEAYDGVESSFWKSDGTSAGTVKLKNINAFGTEYCISNGILYFYAMNDANSQGSKLWKTDGTSHGTQAVKDINPNSSNYYPTPYYLTDVNATLFFIADDGVHGNEIWKSDGTEQGTQLVKDITPGADGSNLDNLVSYDDKLYFTNNGVLWSSDGTEDGTMPVDDPVVNSITISNVVATGNKLFLSGTNHKYGAELYEGEINESEKFVASSVTSNAIKTTDNHILLYPNPAKDILNINLGSINISKATLQVTNVAGNVLINKAVELSGKQNVLQLNVSQLVPGSYFINLISTDGTKTSVVKFEKQ